MAMFDSTTVFNEDSQDIDFRVESNGNANRFFVNGGDDTVLFGTTASQVVGGDTSGVQIFGTTQADAHLAITRNSANNGYPNLSFGKSRNASPGSFTSVADDDYLGAITWNVDDGSDMASAGAQIMARIDGTPGTNDVPTELQFRTTPDGSAAHTEKLNIGPEGDVTVVVGDLVFATADKGIVLGATSNTAANTLDDYEEGTWTPGMSGSTTAGNHAYHGQTGSYTKIGRVVHVEGQIHINTIGTMDGNVSVTGLPFTVGTSGYAFSFSYAGAMSLNAGVTPVGYSVASGTTFIIRAFDVSTGTTILNQSEIGNNTQVVFSGTYIT
jgi:hypothetical protein